MIALVELLDVLQPLGVLVYVDPVIRDALLPLELLGLPAVWTPGSAVHGNISH